LLQYSCVIFQISVSAAVFEFPWHWAKGNPFLICVGK